MSIGENTTLFLHRQNGCPNCKGFDFCGSLCLNCSLTHSNPQVTLPISIKTCQNTSQKAATLHSSLSSSLTVASPPPIFTFIEEEENKRETKIVVQSAANGRHGNVGQIAINEQLFKEYRDVSASSTTGLSSTFEFSISEDDEDEDDDEEDDDSDDDYSDSTDTYPMQWRFEDYFSGLPGNDWCVRVPVAFIHDEFNLFELPDIFKCPLRLTDYPNNPEKSNLVA